MAEYRSGRWRGAINVLQKAEGDPDRRPAALASCFGAMARHQAGLTAAAREVLDRASQQLQGLQRTGVLPGNEWHYVVFGLVARAEAERLILGREVSPPVTVESLAEVRQKWKVVREILVQGEALAAEGRWKASRDAYVRALDHPSFDWDAAEEESTIQCLSLQMSTVFVLAGDRTNHGRLCALLLRLGSRGVDSTTVARTATARAERYARACFLLYQSLNQEVGHAALELARYAVANQQKRMDYEAGWACLSGGMAELYAGDPSRALELLQGAQIDQNALLRGMATVYRAMVLKKLKRSVEAVQALRDGEELLKSSRALDSSRYWWDVEQSRMALKEARQLISPETK
jgi:tetratricopeptide (TPR) repeat protein